LGLYATFWLGLLGVPLLSLALAEAFAL